MSNPLKNGVAKKKIKWTDDLPFEIIRMLLSIVIALFVTFIVLCFVSKTPVDDFIQLLTYPLQGKFYFGYVLIKMVPLTFAGLATLLYFRTGLFNLSTEGYLLYLRCCMYLFCGWFDSFDRKWFHRFRDLYSCLWYRGSDYCLAARLSES